MLEIDRDESQQIEEKGGDMGSRQVSGLGALLKAEREKRGLSHDQVVEITRLRRHFIEALENEDWNNLPSSVFVRGFIRSYARTLNLDEKKVFDLNLIGHRRLPTLQMLAAGHKDQVSGDKI